MDNKTAAGCIFYAKDTGKFMLLKRSGEVSDGLTWGTIGGMAEANETPVDALRREIKEETKYKEYIQPKLLNVYSEGNFKYFNFLVIVPKEFKPKLNKENVEYQWFDLENLPSPLHSGVVSMLPHLRTSFKDRVVAKYKLSEKDFNLLNKDKKPNKTLLKVVNEYKKRIISK